MKLQKDERAKAFIFDLDGTLIDSMEAHFQSWQKVAKKYSFKFSKDFFLETAGMPSSKIANKINSLFSLSIDPNILSNEKQSMYLESLDKIEPIEPVAAIAKKYFGLIPMSVGTGTSKNVAIKTLEMAGLKKYFDIIVAADNVTHHKPHPETFLVCASLMGVEPTVCQVFEDGELGLVAAREAKMIATDIRNFV